jgi:DNA-binding response OmpR family regulator
MSAKVTGLVVSADPHAAATLGFTLETQDLAVLLADNRADALHLMHGNGIDLVVLDVLVPADDLLLCKEIRRISDVAILIVSALVRHEDVIAGLEHGADDYVAKPFHPREVALRAKSLLRRHIGSTNRSPMQVGALRLDPIHHAAFLAEQRLDLSDTEFRLLSHLVANRGVPQSWRTLLRTVWGAHNLVGGRDIVKSAVYRLRSRLGDQGAGTGYITTLRGVGYLTPDLPREQS